MAMLSPVMVTGEITVRLPLLFPSTAAAVPVTGVVKANPATVVHPDAAFNATLPDW